MTNETNKTQVLIVGAGPTGLTAAIELARRGIAVRMVDKVLPRPYSESRAEGIHAKSLEIFERQGLLPEVLRVGKVLRSFSFFANGHQIGQMAFKGLDSPHNHAVLLPQSEIERVMLEHLVRLGVTVERPVELVGFRQDRGGVYITLRDKEGREKLIVADYLIAADGGHSLVRKGLGLDFDGHQMQGAYVMDAEADFKLPLLTDAGNFVLGPHGFLVLGLRPDGLWRLALSLPRSDHRMSRETPSLEQMQAILDEDFPALGANLRRTSWVSAFFISSRIVKELRRDRIFLVGDAAHIHSPVGGQGMNTGIQDAANLAWKIALRLEGRGDERLLNSYTAERYPVMERLIRTTNATTDAILITNPVAIQMRNFLIAQLTRFPAFQTALVSSFTGFKVRYTRSPILSRQHRLSWLSGPRVGEIGPDAPGLRDSQSRARRWYEVWGQDTRHQLLIFAGSSKTSQEQAQRLMDDISLRHSSLVCPHLVLWGTNNQPKKEGDLLDTAGQLHRRYLAGKTGGLYLIRPDGYLAVAQSGLNNQALTNYLATVLSQSPTDLSEPLPVLLEARQA